MMAVEMERSGKSMGRLWRWSQQEQGVDWL